KLLVCRRYGEGLELLRALAAAGVPWVGFEPTTPKRLALDLVPPSITSRLTLLDDFDEQALIDLAIDEVLQHPTASSWQASLSEGVGLRRALSHSVQALRLGGITAEAVRSHVDDPARAELLAGVLEAYDRRRAAAGAGADGAGSEPAGNLRSPAAAPRSARRGGASGRYRCGTRSAALTSGRGRRRTADAALMAARAGRGAGGSR